MCIYIRYRPFVPYPYVEDVTAFDGGCGDCRETSGVEDWWVSERPVEPALGDVAVGCLGQVGAVPAPVVGGVLARVRPRLAALGRQVEVVLAHAWRTAAGPRCLLQQPCAKKRKGNVHQNMWRIARITPSITLCLLFGAAVKNDN